ncbi:MAG: hypothetical protein ACYC2Y_02960 [Armatimonadota bacterium]
MRRLVQVAILTSAAVTVCALAASSILGLPFGKSQAAGMMIMLLGMTSMSSRAFSTSRTERKEWKKAA